MVKKILVLTAVIFLSSCASHQPKIKLSSIDFKNAVTPEGEKLFCHLESILGTHIKTMTCLTRPEKNKISKASVAFVNRLKSGQ